MKFYLKEEKVQTFLQLDINKKESLIEVQSRETSVEFIKYADMLDLWNTVACCLSGHLN